MPTPSIAFTEFRVRRDKPAGYYLQDRATFNNWGDVRRNGAPFVTRAEAEAYAVAAWEFKTGRRSYIPDPLPRHLLEAFAR